MKWNVQARKAIAAIILATACEQSPTVARASRRPTIPVSFQEEESVDAVQAVTGHYEFVGINTGNDFKYSLSAIRHMDGSVSGEVEERTTLEETGELQRTMHGTVTCFTIVGSTAFVAGIVDRVLTFVPGQENLVPGAGFRLVVVDNGNGANDPPDTGSNARFGVLASSETFCNNPVPFNLEAIEHGNVEIHP